jgi:hypothetical protein
MRAPRFALSAILVVALGLLAMGGLHAGTAWLVPVNITGPVGDGSANGRERGWFTTRGFHRPEVETPGSRHFSWTSRHSEIRVANIDRARPYRLTLRIRAGRGPATEPPPHLMVSIDGAARLRTDTVNERREYRVDVPASGSSTLVAAIDVSDTFVPGPGDRRELGVVVEQIGIEPADGVWQPTFRVALLLGLVTMVFVSVSLAGGLTPRWAAAVGVVTAAAHVWLLTRDGTFLGSFADRLLNISVGVGLAGGAIAVMRARYPAPRVAPDWSLAAVVTIVAAAMKIAFFTHPNVALADSIFQVHRAQNVVAGEYFFTSITPRPFFEFPYAIALYVAALPLWSWFPGELDRVRLLRGIAIVADALVGLTMYFGLRRAWPDSRAPLAFAALWPFARAPLGALCTSNLTNLFGQGLFGSAMALVAWMAASGQRSLALVMATTVLMAGAYLSHFSTISVGIPLVVAVGILLWITGTAAARRLGVVVLTMALVASSVSYVLYYSHFTSVYQGTINRVLAGDGAGEERSMTAPVSVKAERSWGLVRSEFGLPVLVTALAGIAWLIPKRREPAVVVLGGWGLTWLAFLVLGILTPVQMRANLAAAPLILACASFALDRLANRSNAGFSAASVIGLAIVWHGFTRWMHCLTG